MYDTISATMAFDEYNYASFPQDLCADDFSKFPNGVRVGQRAPDGTLVDAATGVTVRLSDFWTRGLLVLEFGSLT